MSRSPRLLNIEGLAKALGRSQFYVSAMKKAGYVMQYGTRTTRDHALAWLEANPGFRSSRAYRRKAVAA
jgi:hypothetical protein